MTLASTARQATMVDLESIVSVHEAAFPGFFLTMLGHRFLRELYRTFIVDQEGICWVAEAELSAGQLRVVGFVAGTLKPAGFFRRILFRRGFHFAVAALPGLISHPLKVLPRLLAALMYRGDPPTAVRHGALLSSLGVHPRVGRRGLGRVLVNVFCEYCARIGSPEVYLITDTYGNEAANRFYESAGFRLVNTRVRPDGRTMHTYVRTTGLKGDQ